MHDNDTSRAQDEARARLDWQQRIYRRLTDTTGAEESSRLPAPTGLSAVPAAGHVLLQWEPVPGAAGYLIERTEAGGEPRIVDHGGSDVPAIGENRFADTGIDDDVMYTYRVAAVAGADLPAWQWSEPVTGRTGGTRPRPLTLSLDTSQVVGRLHRVWWMVGSERLTQLRFGDDGHGNDIGTEFADALALAAGDLGVGAVRAHAILHDDNHVVTRDDEGRLRFDFSEIDALYDRILALGVHPVVELSFMPAVLARDPRETVFTYHGIISPPADWAQWRELVRALAQHLVDRYGIDEVAGWGFEVWNEPNLQVFWSGTQQEYFRLYDEAAAAVKQVDRRLLIGGPATAAAEWIQALVRHCTAERVPLDFVTSHTYGNLPLDTRPATAATADVGDRVWWTEWGVGHTHFGPIHDGVAGAPFVLAGYRAAQDRLQALAYWVISDHFEELGRPTRLLHNGFGLLTVGNLRKPRYWAAHLAAHQGDQVLAHRLSGDGAEVLVQAWATRHPDGMVDLLLWNGTRNADLLHGDPRLVRAVEIEIDGLTGDEHLLELSRIDLTHSNIGAVLPEDTQWPDSDQWQQLRAADVLHLQQLPRLRPDDDGVARLSIELPQPGVARLRITPGISD